MSDLLKGISLGVGFVLGILLVCVFVSIVIYLLWILYKYMLRRRFTPDLFYKYGKDLLKHEKFEELETVKQIIKRLEKNDYPKDMLKFYKIHVDTDFTWIPTPDGGERLTLKRDIRIKKKNA
jgi:hypothetical protein